MLFRIKLILILLIPLSVNIFSQIYSIFPHNSRTAEYNSEDSVFIFNRPSFGEKNNVSISVQSPDGLNGWTYNWYVFNTSTLSYYNLGVSVSVDTITSSAGYQVVATKDATTISYRAWIVFNDFNISITSKNAEGNLPHQIPFTQCDLLQINSSLETVNKNYYNPLTGAAILVRSDFVYSWSKDKESGTLPVGRNISYVSDPPWEDTRYTITVTDNHGLQRKDSVFYESVHPKADVKFEYIPLSDKNYYPEEYSFYYGWDDDLGKKNDLPAPAKIKITNSGSENSVRYLWTFGDNSEDTTTFEEKDTIIHEYMYPGKYTIKLYTWGEAPYNCPDSMILDKTEQLGLAESTIGATPGADSLVFPNVFTPNDDGFNTIFRNFDPENHESAGTNDVFRTYDISVYQFSIIIFNRFGKKVHEFNGNIRDWEGWDGKILNSNRDATEGVYYYVVDMILAFELTNNNLSNPNEIARKKYNKKQQTGFVHLFREPR